MARESRDAPAGDTKARSDGLFADHFPRLDGTPDSLLRHDNHVAAREYAQRSKMQPGTAEPIPQDLMPARGAARADHLDIRVREFDQASDIAAVNRLLPHLDEGDGALGLHLSFSLPIGHDMYVTYI